MNDNQNELLQKAIAELKNSPTVDIKGKSYTQVSTRINVFRKYFPTASIETLITYNDDIRVIIQTKISLNDRVIATGYAEEVRGDGNYINQTSAVNIIPNPQKIKINNKKAVNPQKSDEIIIEENVA